MASSPQIQYEIEKPAARMCYKIDTLDTVHYETSIFKKYTEKEFEVTAYCPCEKCCGKWAKVPDSKRQWADGTKFSRNAHVVAGPKWMKFGTKLMVPGYNNDKIVICKDRGGAIKGYKLDLFFKTHKEALQWGRKKVIVRIYK
jgi:3D (Asp-Asp-Asp) domain-containing protein